jgi:phage FluMu gp28-like protein
MLNVPYDQQRQVAFYLIDRLPKFIGGAMDATGNGGYLAEACALKYGQVERNGELVPKVEAVSITDKWYASRLPPLRAAFEDDQIRIVRDADHLLDLAAFKVVNGLPKLPAAKTATTGDGPARHGDAGIAYALAYYASCLPAEAYDYQAPTRALTHSASRAYAPAAGSGFKRARGGML